MRESSNNSNVAKAKIERNNNVKENGINNNWQ